MSIYIMCIYIYKMHFKLKLTYHVFADLKQKSAMYTLWPGWGVPAAKTWNVCSGDEYPLVN